MISCRIHATGAAPDKREVGSSNLPRPIGLTGFRGPIPSIYSVEMDHKRAPSAVLEGLPEPVLIGPLVAVEHCLGGRLPERAPPSRHDIPPGFEEAVEGRLPPRSEDVGFTSKDRLQGSPSGAIGLTRVGANSLQYTIECGRLWSRDVQHCVAWLLQRKAIGARAGPL